ncbi:MAG: hypothetical protein O2780_10840 [Proteobacteria bacterium]|jgi:hypothetical protein|nr:hypothetical protein [Pseudomonadota bacterium]MDA1301407.1 hypothetical protein [Pseudomonadota bacterium]
MKTLTTALATMAIVVSVNAIASVDSDFKERPTERFTIYTGDGNYKQAYHWSFNEDGQGTPVTIFLNHGSGGEWYDEIDTEFGPCGPDYLSNDGDFDGSAYEGLCEVDGQGNEIYLADFNHHHVPVGVELEKFMIRKIVGSTQFAAWYWQDAFSQFDSPVHIFMVGRYNVVTDPGHLDNALYWLKTTDQNLVTRETLPPYNFDGYGVDGIDGEFRPMHAAPDIAGFDNMFLYKAVREQYPTVSLDNVIVEGRSNGGSAMIAMASDYHIWPQHIRDFWARNLPADEAPAPEPEVVPGLTLNDVLSNPVLATAFEELLANYSEQDLLNVINNGGSLTLANNGNLINGTAGVVPQEPDVNDGGLFNPDTFRTQLQEYVDGDFYASVKIAHAFYPGCRLDGLMQQDVNLPANVVAADGDTANGYKVAIPLMMSFGDEDSLYTSHCDDRVNEGQHQTAVAGVLVSSDITDGTRAVVGEVFSPAEHGFDYANVYKNQPDDSLDDQSRAAESRRAIERVVNQAIRQTGFIGTYSLPNNVD